MLKKRVIGVIVVKEGLAVQSFNFQRYLPIGRPEIAVEYLNRWGADEILVLNIDGVARTPFELETTVKCFSRLTNVPLAIGGGIYDFESAQAAISNGADKVVLNTSLIESPDLSSQIASVYGEQAVVASIDVRQLAPCSWRVLHKRKLTNIDLVDFLQKTKQFGAGEVLLTNADHDGGRSGYDLTLIETAVPLIETPLIICGGAKWPSHFTDGARKGASALAAANIFNHFEHSIILIKKALEQSAISVRLDSYVNYKRAKQSQDGRLQNMDEFELDALRFRYVAEEKI